MNTCLLSGPTRWFGFRVCKLLIQEISEDVVYDFCLKSTFFSEIELYTFSEAGRGATTWRARPTGRLTRTVATQLVLKVSEEHLNRPILTTMGARVSILTVFPL